MRGVKWFVSECCSKAQGAAHLADEPTTIHPALSSLDAWDHSKWISGRQEGMYQDAWCTTFVYKIGLTKVFLKYSDLAELEERRDECPIEILTMVAALYVSDLYLREISEKCAMSASATSIKEILWRPIKLAIQSSSVRLMRSPP